MTVIMLKIPSFATLATPEVVAEMVDMRKLVDRCKDTTFEARAMFEVVAEVLDMKMLDIAKKILDVDEQRLEVDIRRRDNIVDGCNDTVSRTRITVIDFDAWSRLASSMLLVDFNAWRINGDVGLLTKRVDVGKDSSSRITVVDNDLV